MKALVLQLKLHYLAIVLAVLLGLASSLPQILSARAVPGFQGIYHGVVDDQVYYEARTKDVLDGHAFLSNPYIYEYKSGPPMQVWLPDYLRALLPLASGLSIWRSTFIYDFFFPALLFILCYGIVFLLTSSRLTGLLAASVLNGGFFVAEFIRSPSPQFNFVFWLATLLFLLLFMKGGKKRYAVLAAVSLGFLFNLYPYYWTFYIVALTVFLFIKFVMRQRQAIWTYVSAAVGGFIIGIPYFISLIQSSRLPWNAESLARLGLIPTHFPSGSSIVAIGLLTLVFLTILHRKGLIGTDDTSLLLLAGVAAAMIVVNQHLVTGKNLEFSSHYFMESVYWCAFAVCYGLTRLRHLTLVSRYKKAIAAAAIIAVVIVVIRGMTGFVNAQVTYTADEVYAQNYAPVFAWLNAHTQKDDVVFADEDMSDLIPVYTADNVFYAQSAELFLMPDMEVETRFIIENFWDKIDAPFLVTHERAVWGTYYVNIDGHYRSENGVRKLLGLPPIAYQRIPAQKINEALALSAALHQKSFADDLKPFRVDYLVWDRTKEPDWPVARFDFLKPVFSAGNISVYKILR